MHYSVLLEESIELLNIKPDGVYVDGTFGRGGHSRAILNKLNNSGRLIAFDKDIEAIEYGKKELNDPRLTLIHDSFANLDKHLAVLNLPGVDGVLLDLGVSSPQLDDKTRGFSFRFDTELDMRMDNTSGISAKDWLNQVSEKELATVLWQYGEEKFSHQIARNIVAKRKNLPIVTTFQLAKIIEQSMPFKEKGQHPATRSFQAIRIVINNELVDLEKVLAQIPQVLNVLGRFVVISFHSLEDRIVKNSFTDFSSSPKMPKWVMLEDPLPEYKVIAKKIKASDLELRENKRSRSAILRCLERLLGKKN